MTNSAEVVGVTEVTRWLIKYPVIDAVIKTIPPIVGVPRFT